MWGNAPRPRFRAIALPPGSLCGIGCAQTKVGRPGKVLEGKNNRASGDWRRRLALSLTFHPMLTYQVRPRHFKFAPDAKVTFPANCEIAFHFRPDQPFGMRADGGRTAVRATAARALFSMNSGEHTIESKPGLSPLGVGIQGDGFVGRLAGRILTVSRRFESLRELEELTASISYCLPMVLTVPFADPPYVERVQGRIGEVPFSWELQHGNSHFLTTTQEEQEGSFSKAWNRLSMLSEPKRRRVIASLHCFHVACRLARVGATAGEFVAEVVLNLAKALETLFPRSENTGSMDTARAGLRSLGIKDAEIEAFFVPAIALRNELDVGHPQLALLSAEELRAVHDYTDTAELSFRNMYEELLTRIEAGTFEIKCEEPGPAGSKIQRLVERLRKNTDQAAKATVVVDAPAAS